jgi:hypothetical protein
MTARERAADLRYAAVAKRHGLQNSLRALWEARSAGISPALALAMLEQESGGRNVWGHDPVQFPKAWMGKPVKKAHYLEYRKNRRAGRWGMQGCGPMQLTWWEFQDGADDLGGCWVVKYNLRYGYRRLRDLIALHGLWTGVQRYNGSGPMSERYVREVQEKYEKWHKRLHGR